MCATITSMVRLNRNALDRKKIDALFGQLATAIAPSDAKHANKLLTELLGREERIMLAKRLAAIVLLAKGVSRYKISRTLKLSQSTVEHILRKSRNGHFNTTLKTVSRTKKDYLAFLDTLDNILHLGGILLHYSGSDRYRSVR